VLIGDYFDFSALAPFSLEAWVKSDGCVTDCSIISKVTETGGFQGYELGVDAVSVGIALYGGAGDGLTASLPGEFAHVVATFDGTIMRLYINGAFAGLEFVETSLTDHDGDFFIGASSNGWFFDGAIDEVAIYDHALAEDRVLAHYQAGTP
jgi:hypothetical protein